jgi:hypothetical protein
LGQVFSFANKRNKISALLRAHHAFVLDGFAIQNVSAETNKNTKRRDKNVKGIV